MEKTKKRLIKVLFMVIVIQFTLFISVAEASFWSDIISQGDDFLQLGVVASKNSSSVSDINTMRILDDMYGVLLILGVVVTVMVGGFLGIKFMLASAEDKAKVKESMVPYVIGCIVIYGAFGIWRICIQIFSVLS